MRIHLLQTAVTYNQNSILPGQDPHQVYTYSKVSVEIIVQMLMLIVILAMEDEDG